MQLAEEAIARLGEAAHELSTSIDKVSAAAGESLRHSCDVLEKQQDEKLELLRREAREALALGKQADAALELKVDGVESSLAQELAVLRPSLSEQTEAFGMQLEQAIARISGQVWC